MKVATYYSNDDVRVEEMDKPEISSKEILVKVIASGICGSDVMQWYRIKSAPRILGHEIAGEIVEVGEEVEDYEEGQRVFVSHHVPCGECRYCKNGHTSVCDTLRSTNFYPGGFSEYIRVPEINVEKGVYILPDEMSYEEGVFIEPLACVVRGQNFAEIEKDNSVLVIGSGISGLLHIQLAKAKGASKVLATDLKDYRLDAAKELGADQVFKADELTPVKVKRDNDGLLADRVIVCAGAVPAMEQAFKSVGRGGKILLFAPLKPDENVPLPVWDLWKDEISITTSYAAGDGDINEAIRLIDLGSIDVDKMITHQLGMEEAPQGFSLVAEADESIKVIIKPHE
ncbi:MAG: alcohol dehydrogenase catalytic domain-containing protein [Thermoplasmatota archaeon]